MKANPSDQRQILDIQNFDFTTATLKNKAANLPEIAEINKLTIRANNARDLRIAAQTENLLFFGTLSLNLNVRSFQCIME